MQLFTTGKAVLQNCIWFCCTENPACSLGSFLPWQWMWSRISPTRKAALASDGNSAPISFNLQPKPTCYQINSVSSSVWSCENTWVWGTMPRGRSWFECRCLHLCRGAGGRQGSIAIQHTDAAGLNRALRPFNPLFDHLWNRSRQNHPFPLWQKELAGFSVLNIPSCSGNWAQECHLLTPFLCAQYQGLTWESWGASPHWRAGVTGACPSWAGQVGLIKESIKNPRNCWERTELVVYQHRQPLKLTRGILTNGASGESWYYEDQ